MPHIFTPPKDGPAIVNDEIVSRLRIVPADPEATSWKLILQCRPSGAWNEPWKDALIIGRFDSSDHQTGKGRAALALIDTLSSAPWHITKKVQDYLNEIQEW